jgi:hypothetical protein
MSIKTHFSDIRERVREQLEGAKKQILVAMAWLTDAELWQALLDAQKRGAKVRLLIAKDDINSNSGIAYAALQQAGGDFYIKDMSNVGTYSKMHNKFCIIDEKIAITGSYNWTNQAPRNAENIIILEDAEAAKSFAAQFDQLSKDAININYLDSDLWQFKDPYKRQITRINPTALMILLDQSGSMSSGGYEIHGKRMNKAEAAAFYVNTLLDELLAKCTKDGGMRDYIDVCLLGYGADGKKAAPAWCGALAGRNWVTINELETQSSQKPVKITKTIRGVTREIDGISRYWLEPVAESTTPMGDALRQSRDLLTDWVKQHEQSFPPIVINITDGEATDVKAAELIDLAAQIKDLHTENGRVLFFNCHLGDNAQEKCLYPQTKTELPQGDKYADTLFEMSSILPTVFHGEISKHTSNFDANCRYTAMFYNADAMGLTRILQLGTTKI